MPLIMFLLLLWAFNFNLYHVNGNDENVHYEEGYCAPYNGKICKSFISSGQVWYSREDSTGGWENEKITTNLWQELILGLNGLCRLAAEVSLLCFLVCCFLPHSI